MSGNPQSARSPLMGVDRQKLEGVIEPIARAHGAEVVDMELKPERGTWILRLFVEKLGAQEQNLSTQQAAVDLELCSNVSRDLSTALDVADLIPHSYTLEVSSPGVERALKKERDYVRFAGKKAKLRLTNAIAGQKVLIGTIGVVENGRVGIDDGPRHHDVPLADIESGRLVFEFGRGSHTPGKRPR